MKYEIKYRPSYSMLIMSLDSGRSVTAESGAMTYMSPNVEVKTRMRERGILGTLGLTFLRRQSFFVNDYTSLREEGRWASFPLPWKTSKPWR